MQNTATRDGKFEGALAARVRAQLDEIGSVTGLGVVYHDLHERRLLINRRTCAFCRRCLEHPATASLCRYDGCHAAMQAFSSGEPFYSQCWAGLLFVTVAVAPRNAGRGGISLGGFFSAGQDKDLQGMLAERLQMLPRRDLKDVLATVHSLRQITPSALRGLGVYAMEATFSSGLNQPSFFAKQNAKYKQQREIAEAAAELRRDAGAPPDILADTYQLVSYLNQKDRPAALRFISTYLAKLLMASNWDLTKLKAHLRVLLAVMTSQDVLRGMDWDTAVNRELRYMLRLEQAEDTESSCYEVAEVVMQHMASPEAPFAQPRASLLERTTTWLQRHYGEKVRLPAAARAIGVSPSTLIHSLRRQTGKTFHQLLHETRIAEARRLLASTQLEISEIADRCGFTDQSHFTKALKLAVNLTPGQFRRLLVLTPEEVLKA